MSPLRIHLSGLFAPTPLILMVISGLVFLSPQRTNAQCPAGNAQKSLTYFNDLGASGGNTFNFTVPQFNPLPAGYTLLSVVASATATTLTLINYQNTDTSNTQDFFPSIFRKDKLLIAGTTIAAPPLNEYDYNETFLQKKNTAGDNVTYGLANTFQNTPLFSTTITDPLTLSTTYEGSGNLAVKYTSTFFVSNFIPSAVNVTAALSDNIKLSITYNYCDPTVLASNILSFTATRTNSGTVDLKWQTTNEQSGRTYYVEVSPGGQDFTPVASVLSDANTYNANYNYDYAIPSSATGKLYFRLRQVEADGTTTWSDIRTINLDGDGQAFSIYPNPPSDFINLTLPGGNQDWQVDIVAADGRMVQRNYYPNSNAARVNFIRRLAAGAYFVRVMNPQTGKHYSGSFLMR
jgi:hypothetical protein